MKSSDDSLNLRLQITLLGGTEARPLLLLVRELGGAASYPRLMPSGEVVMLPVPQAEYLTSEESEQIERNLEEAISKLDPTSSRISEQIEFIEAERELNRNWKPSEATGETSDSQLTFPE